MNLQVKKAIDGILGRILVGMLYFPVRLVGRLLGRSHDLAGPRHIAIVKMLGGGSLVMNGSALLALREKYPECRLSLLCTRAVKGFGEELKLFDEIVVIDDTGLWPLIKSGLGAVWWLNRNVDVTIDLEIHSRLTTVLTTISCVHNRIGLVDHISLWRRRIYTHALYVSPLSGVYDAYDGMVGFWNISSLQNSKFLNRYRKQVSDFSLNPALRSRLTASWVAVGVGCSDTSLERQMNADLWTGLLRKHVEQSNSQIVFLGAKRERELAQKIAHRLPADRVLNLCGETSLSESTKILSEATAYLGIDSALLHFARLLGKDVVGFWGPTKRETLLKPYSLRELHFSRGVSCSPCVHITQTPPCMGQNVCMNFSNSEIIQAAEFLAKTETAPTLPSRQLQIWLHHPDQKAPRLHEITVV